MQDLADTEQALAQLLEFRDAEDSTNQIDEIQKLHFKQRKASLLRIVIVLNEQKQMIREENVEKFMKLIDECVRYLRWTDDSPFDEDDYQIFNALIYSTVRNVWPHEFGDDEKTVSIRSKLVYYILNGEYLVYMTEIWSKVKSIRERLEEDQEEKHVWEKMTENEKRDIDRFKLGLEMISNCFEEQMTPDMITKISHAILPCVFKCVNSILVFNLVIDDRHPQVRFTMLLICVLNNCVEVMHDNMPRSDRMHFLQIFQRYINAPTKPPALYAHSILSKSLCFTINELKTEQLAEMKLSNNDSIILLTSLRDAVFNGSVKCANFTIRNYDAMMTIQRYFLINDNQEKLLKSEPDIALLDLILKGVESSDKRLQTQSLECCMIIAEDENLIRHLKTKENCLSVLKGVRKSPDMSVRQKAVDVLLKIMIKKPNELKVTRKRLERSNCIRWSEADVREKMKECRLVLQPDIDTTGWVGEWLVELLATRREDNVTYLNTIESQFQIKLDTSCIEFNLAMRKLEKMVLSEDLSHEPDHPSIAELTQAFSD